MICHSLQESGESTLPSESIIDIKVNPNPQQSHQLVVGASGVPNILLVYDLQTGKVQSLEGHSRTVSELTFTCDGGCFVTGSYDNTLRVWSSETGDCLGVFGKRNDSLDPLPSNGPLLSSQSLPPSTPQRGRNRRQHRNVISPSAPHQQNQPENETVPPSFLPPPDHERGLKVIQNGHTNKVERILAHPLLPHLVVSSSADLTVQIWDVDKISSLTVWKIPWEGSLTEMSFLRGKYVFFLFLNNCLQNFRIMKILKTRNRDKLIGSVNTRDGVVAMWDLAADSLLGSFQAHSASVSCLDSNFGFFSSWSSLDFFIYSFQ